MTTNTSLRIVLDEKHETKNYVRFTTTSDDRQFAGSRGGSRFTAYLTSEEYASLGSPERVVLTADADS